MAEETSWEEIDISLFKNATEQLKYDEFIFDPEKLNTYYLQYVLHIGEKKLDSHLQAQRDFTFEDYMQYHPDLPNENITPDQIRGVIGKLIDCQVNRWCGFNIFRNILLCSYIHNNFKSKNPLLQVVLDSFSHCIVSTEEFCKSSNSYQTSEWYPCDSSIKYFRVNIDVEKTLSTLQELSSKDPSISDITSICEWELKLGQYLLHFPSDPIPILPFDKIPQTTSDLGFSDDLHVRDLSISAPSRILLPNHEKSLEILQSNYDMMKDISLIKFPETMNEFFEFCFNWTRTHRNASYFTRCHFFAKILIFLQGPTPESAMISKFIQNDLNNWHIPPIYFKNSNWEAVLHYLTYKVLHDIAKICTYNCDDCCKGLEKKGIIQIGEILSSIELFERSMFKPSLFPKTQSDQINAEISSPFSSWISLSAATVAINYLLISYQNEVFNPTDFPSIFFALKLFHKTKAKCLSAYRVSNAVYKIREDKRRRHQTGPIHSSDIQKVPVTPQEAFETALSDYFDAAVYVCNWGISSGAIDIKYFSGLFSNPGKVYNERFLFFQKFTGLGIVTQYEVFQKIIGIEKGSLQEIAIKKLNMAKKSIADQIAVVGKTEELTDLLKRVVMVSLKLSKWTNQSLTVTLTNDIPNFEFK